jgi:PKD repeat protein
MLRFGKGRFATGIALVAGTIGMIPAAPASAQTCADEVEGPTAAFAHSPAAPAAGTSVSFDASSSSAGQIHRSEWSHVDESCATIGSQTDEIDSYRWDFGDGTAPETSAAPTTTHVFADPGTYTVTLTVTTSATGSDTASQTVGVRARLTVTTTTTPFGIGGTVTSNDDPRQIDCGSMCTGTYTAGGNVRLTATPAPGYRFVSWFGACSGTSPMCDLSMTENKAVQAAFQNPAPAVSFVQPEGQWVRGTMHMQVSLTDDSAINRPVEFELRQRNAVGSYVATNARSAHEISGGQAFATLYPSTTYADHPQGVQVSVRACDTLNSCGTSTRTYGIDRVQPTITETSDGPAAVVGPGTQVLRFSTADATSGVASRMCRLDNGPAQPCAASGIASQWKMESTHTTSGRHNWTIEVRDVAGLPRTITRTFTVDADPPETVITSGPADGSSSTATTAEFAFGTTPAETGATYRCRIFSVTSAPAVFGDCSGPGATHVVSGLPPGTYRFEVAARDAVGNTDSTPVGRTFTVTAAVTDGGGGGGDTGGDRGSTGGSTTGTSIGESVGTTATTPTNTTVVQTPPQQNAAPPATKPGKCAKLKGKKRAACVRKQCGKLNKKKTAKKYRACVKKVTRKR